MKNLKLLLLIALILSLLAVFLSCKDNKIEDPNDQSDSVSESESESEGTDAETKTYRITVRDAYGFLTSVNTDETGGYALVEIPKEGYTFEGFFDNDGNAFGQTGTVTENVEVFAKYAIKETNTFEELKTRAEAGAREIYITNDIVLTDTVCFVGKTTVYTNAAHVLTRDAAFSGDLFVVGEMPDGGSVINVYGKGAEVVLESRESGSLTVDGNKQSMTVDVYGSAFFIANGSTVELCENITVTNCKKTGNSRISKYTVSSPDRAGGAAAMIVNGSLTLSGAALTDNEVNTEETTGVSYCGGAIFNFSTLKINGGTLSGNQASRGGAVMNYRDVSITAGILENNSASNYGGVLYLADSQYCAVHIGSGKEQETAAVMFKNNTSQRSGGVIFGGIKTSVIINGSTLFEGNRSVASNGGAINTSGALTVHDATFKNNESASKGGAVYVYYSDETGALSARETNIYKGLFEGNRAPKGGAFSSSITLGDEHDSQWEEIGKSPMVYIGNVVFKDNQAYISEGETDGGTGGALYISRKSMIKIEGASFVGNTAEDKGGAAYITQKSEALLQSLEFSKNTAKTGGAVSTHSDSIVKITKSTFTDNEATGTYAGAVGIWSASDTTLVDCTVSGSKAKDNGGAIYVNGAKGTVKNSTFTGNQSEINGGAIYSTKSTLAIEGTTFKLNKAAEDGGALYLTTNSVTSISNNTLLESNSAVGGGAVYMTASAQLTVNDTEFRSNTSSGNGGALYAYTSTVYTLTNVTFTQNTASGKNGGGIYASGASQGKIYGLSAIENSAKNGGFLYITTTDTVCELWSKATVTEGSAISGNTATSGGSFIWSNTTKCTVGINYTAFPEYAENGASTADIAGKDGKITINELTESTNE